MIDAILNVPEEILELDEEKIYTPKKANIIIIFLNNNFKITAIGKKKYEEWVQDERISQKFATNRILDCQRFIGKKEIQPSRKGFGGQFGMSTCSPIHFKLTKTYNDAIANYLNLDGEKIKGKKYIDDKIQTFLDNGSSGLLNQEFFNSFKDNLSLIIKQIFLEMIRFNGEELYIDYDNEKTPIKDNDYLLIKISDDYIDDFINDHKRFLKEIRNKTNKVINTESYCFFCGIKINKGYLTNVGNYEGKVEKHAQLFHKFYDNINYKSNVLICEDCNSRLSRFIEKASDENKKVLPLPINVRIDFENNKDLIFGRDPLLTKLKRIYELNNQNPFDYVFIKISDENNFLFEDIGNFQYYLTTNNEILNTNLNMLRKGRQLIYKSEGRFSKGDFLQLLNSILLNQLINNLFNEPKNIKIQNESQSLLKFLILNYREDFINMIFKEKYYFQKEGIKRITKEILKEITRRKAFINYFNEENGKNGRRLLIFYYLYSKDEEVKMQIERINKIEEELRNSKEIKLEQDCEAAYLMGQIVNYLLTQSESKKNKLELLGNAINSVSNMEQLKRRIIDLTMRYKHKIYDTKKWEKTNNLILLYEFKNKKLNENLIPFFAGFYAENIFYEKNRGETNE